MSDENDLMAVWSYAVWSSLDVDRLVDMISDTEHVIVDAL